MSLGNRSRGGPFRANRERVTTTISKASGATQLKEVVDRQQIHEFNIQATTPINLLPYTRTAPTLYQDQAPNLYQAPTIYQFLWDKIALTTPMTGRTQTGWVEQVGRETGIPDSFKTTYSIPTRRQPSIPPTVSIRTRTKKTVAMILILAMALALKLPPRTLARKRAPGPEEPTRHVPHYDPSPFQLCRR